MNIKQTEEGVQLEVDGVVLKLDWNKTVELFHLLRRTLTNEVK